MDRYFQWASRVGECSEVQTLAADALLVKELEQEVCARYGSGVEQDLEGDALFVEARLDRRHPPRICAGKEFADWIDKRCQERTQKITEERNLNIKMDPQIYEIFKKSNFYKS